jgi:hypothetical protein
MGTQTEKDDKTFLRQWTIPEEDRAKYTTQAWAGEYRWFRSPNIVCLEHYRQQRTPPAGPQAGPAPHAKAPR